MDGAVVLVQMVLGLGFVLARGAGERLLLLQHWGAISIEAAAAIILKRWMMDSWYQSFMDFLSLSVLIRSSKVWFKSEKKASRDKFAFCKRKNVCGAEIIIMHVVGV